MSHLKLMMVDGAFFPKTDVLPYVRTAPAPSLAASSLPGAAP